MKYAIYIALLLFQIVRKAVGLVWYFIAVPFRRYARNTIYNYALDNGVFLKRLLERPITKRPAYYFIAPYHKADGGHIKRRHVSKIEYILVFWLIWGWLDDDSNEDTIMTNTAMAIVYDGVTTFERTNGLITQVARLKNIPDNTIDKMFIAANRYTAGMATDESARLVIMQEVLDGVEF